MTLPDTFISPTRAQCVSDYKRDYLLRNPGASVTDGSLVDVDANVMADTLAPIYYDATLVGNAAALDNMTTGQLTTELANLGTAFLPAYGASGEVYVSCSSGGTYIPQGREIKNLKTGVRYVCNASALYQNGQAVPVVGVDTGPSTNILATTPPTVLTWTSPPVGCNPQAAVVPQADGTGLSGGSAAETNAQAVARIRKLRASPPASGNDAEYQALILSCPAVPAQQGFTYPSVKGPGTIAACFTLIPVAPGANRIPNPAQIAAMRGWVTGQMPGSDVALWCTIVASPTVVVLKVAWATGGSGWADAAPWPMYAAGIAANGVSVRATNAGVLTPMAFGLYSATMTAPQVGQSIALYDVAGQQFRRKKILTVTVDVVGGLSGYAITVDPSVSDASFTPYAGQNPCPWSDSLNSLIVPVVSYLDTLGPGEQLAAFFDPGLRQKRSPPSPNSFPSVISNRLLGVPPNTTVQAAQAAAPTVTLFNLTTLQDVVLQEPSVPYATPVGSPGVSSNLLTLSNLLAFPE